MMVPSSPERFTVLLAALLLLSAAIIRPAPPDDSRYVGGSMGSALELLAETGRAAGSSDRRAFDAGYDHWATAHPLPPAGASTGAGASTTPAAVLPLAPPPHPVLAGAVGLASAMGLRDLTALALYLESERAEHDNDWELNELCLRAIPMVDPHFVDAYLIRAYFVGRKDPAAAEAILRQGVRWNPEDWELWSDLAWLKLRPVAGRIPDPAAARPLLERAVAVRHPYFVRRLYATLLFHLGDEDGAADQYTAMVEDPTLPEYDRLLAVRGLQELVAGYDRFADRVLRRPGTVPTVRHGDVCPGCGHDHAPGESHDD